MAIESIVGNGENAVGRIFSFSSNVFYPIRDISITQTTLVSKEKCLVTDFFLLSLPCFLTFSQTSAHPWFLCVCRISFLKTLWEKEKLLIMSNFSFSYSVFYPYGELSAVFIIFEIVVFELFQLGGVLNL